MVVFVLQFFQLISIHALREEGDPLLFARRCYPVFISIHALREEGDGPGKLVFDCVNLFLSTPSARRATLRAHSLAE